MTLANAGAFFDYLRANPILGSTLSQSEVDGLNALCDAANGWPMSWCAYLLATAYHETAHTMQPIKEYGGSDYFRRRYDIEGANPKLARQLGNTQPGDGVRFAGRGYVQLTGRSNYAKATRELGHDFVSHPDDMLQAAWAAKVARRGMESGWFTGKSLRDYLPNALGSSSDFKQARRIINGTDKASEIAGYAATFQTALQRGGWHV